MEYREHEAAIERACIDLLQGRPEGGRHLAEVVVDAVAEVTPQWRTGWWVQALNWIACNVGAEDQWVWDQLDVRCLLEAIEQRQQEVGALEDQQQAFRVIDERVDWIETRPSPGSAPRQHPTPAQWGTSKLSVDAAKAVEAGASAGDVLAHLDGKGFSGDVLSAVEILGYLDHSVCFGHLSA